MRVFYQSARYYERNPRKRELGVGLFSLRFVRARHFDLLERSVAVCTGRPVTATFHTSYKSCTDKSRRSSRPHPAVVRCLYTICV